SAGEGGELVQRAAAAQRVGLLAAGRLLPWRSGRSLRRAPAKVGRGEAPPQGKESWLDAEDVTVRGGGEGCFRLRPFCARSGETIHNRLGKESSDGRDSIPQRRSRQVSFCQSACPRHCQGRPWTDRHQRSASLSD